jgi:hypothetical protein
MEESEPKAEEEGFDCLKGTFRPEDRYLGSTKPSNIHTS